MPKVKLTAIWSVLPAMLVLIYVGTLVQYPLDFWQHVTTGRLIWQTGSVPKLDTFTHTITGRAIVNQNWLAQLMMYGMVELGGVPLAQFVIALCYAAAFGLTLALAHRRGGTVRIAAALTIAAQAVAVSNFGIRPQAFAVLLFTGELSVLWRWPGRRWIVLAVGLMEASWTNLHGTFPLGILLPVIFLLASVWQAWTPGAGLKFLTNRAVRCYLACVLAALMTMWCNPNPQHVLHYFTSVVSRSVQRGLDEWLPPTVSDYTGIALLGSTLLTVAILGLSHKKFQPAELLLALALLPLAATAKRMVIWWAMVMPPILAPQLTALLEARRRQAAPEERPALAKFVFLLLLIAITALSTPWTRVFNPLLPASKRQAHADDEPYGAVRFLKDNGCSGRAYNPMEWGSYLTWFLDGRVKVFVDGRVDFFPDEVWKDYLRVGGAQPGWENILDKRQVNLIVWNRRESKLPAALETSPGWKRVYNDRTSVVFLRS